MVPPRLRPHHPLARLTEPPAGVCPAGHRGTLDPMTGRPGDGCDDPRDAHPHWCGTCGASQLFSSLGCTSLLIVPPCPRCSGTNWRAEADELTAPDYREV